MTIIFSLFFINTVYIVDAKKLTYKNILDGSSKCLVVIFVYCFDTENDANVRKSSGEALRQQHNCTKIIVGKDGDIGSLDELNNKIKQIGIKEGSLEKIFFLGHGTKNSHIKIPNIVGELCNTIELGEQGCNDAESFTKVFREYLSSKGEITIYHCWSASTDYSFAELIYDYLTEPKFQGKYKDIKTSGVEGKVTFESNKPPKPSEGAKMMTFPRAESSKEKSAPERCDQFTIEDLVYLFGGGYEPGKEYSVYVVRHTIWLDGMPIPGRVAGTAQKIYIDSEGNIHHSDLSQIGPPALIWPSAEIGRYDIIVDVNDNGIFDLEIDALDHRCCAPGSAGFEVFGGVGGTIIENSIPLQKIYLILTQFVLITIIGFYILHQSQKSLKGRI